MGELAPPKLVIIVAAIAIVNEPNIIAFIEIPNGGNTSLFGKSALYPES